MLLLRRGRVGWVARLLLHCRTADRRSLGTRWNSARMNFDEDHGPPQTKKLKVEPETENGNLQQPTNQIPIPSAQSEKPPPESHIREEHVGITEYISTQPGFFAILKQRYSDFQVHEIALDGTVARLTKFTLPHLQPDTSQEVERIELETLLSDEDMEKLKKLSESCDKTQLVKLKGSDDKEQRTLVHRAIRERFPRLESKTQTDKDIVVSWNARPQKRGWPGGRGNYCKFVLYKENRDTMDAIGVLARVLKMKPSSFQYAGTKDRRAITSQHVTSFRVPAERLLGVNATSKNIKTGNYEYVSEPLKLGTLAGNKFTLVLRNVSCDDHVIDDVMSSLRDVGFINYFGMQRFGTSAIPTHQIGKCLLHSDWKGAIDLILKPRPGGRQTVVESDELLSAREYFWETRDATGTLSRLPKGRPLETQLLHGLEKRGEKNDLLGALNFLPRNTRMMYVHGYGSYVWNRMASHRIQEGGLKPILGDLVWKGRISPEKTRQEKGEVEFLTEDTLPLYTIHDVLLPLPGYDITYPKNKVGEQYHTVLLEDDITNEQLKHRVKDFALPGGYRSLITNPSDVRWEVMYYDDFTLPLTLSDLDVLDDKPQPQSIPGGKNKALKVEFSLPPSTYATMALREVLKMDTSSYCQAQLNTADSSGKSHVPEDVDTMQ